MRRLAVSALAGFAFAVALWATVELGHWALALCR